ncbi:MAG TPA: LptF/LptG family permease, partial [Thermoanaerobaculia bacterium]|nr:LptF/LptG family permease [Thermoanaerobaculia bacterium]
MLSLSRLDRYLLREIAGPTLVGFLAYTGFMLVRGLVLFSDLVFQSSDPLLDTLRVLGYSLPHIVVLTLPISFLLGLLIAFGRLSADSEIVALRAAGVDLVRLYRPVAAVAVGVSLVSLVLIHEAVPRSNRRLSEMRLRLLTFAVAQRIAPGVFSPQFAGKSIYVEGASADRKLLTGLFVADRSPEAEGERLTLAPRGQLEVDDQEGRLWLRLDDATSHHVGSDPRKYDVSSGTVRYLLQETGARSDRPREKLLREQRLDELLRTARTGARGDVERRLAWVEVHKKFALPAAALVFGLVGLPLGLVTRRGGRAAGFAVSVVIVLAYYVLLAVGEARAIDGRLSPALAMWLPDLLLTLVGLLALRRVRRDRPLLPEDVRILPATLPRRRPARPDAAGRPAARLVASRANPRFGQLLDRYVAGRFLRIFALVLLSFVAVYVLIDYLEIADDLARTRPPGHLLVAYYETLLPPIFVDVLPFAFLVAALITVAALVRSSEATAVLASGVSLFRLAAPVLLLAAGAGVLLFLLSERVVPRASAESETLKARLKGVTPPPRALSNSWVRGQAGRFFAVDAYDARSRGVAGLQMIEIDPESFRVRVRASAARAQVLPGQGLLAEDGWIRTFAAGSDSLFLAREGQFLLDAPEAADTVSAVQANPRQMTLGQLARFIAARRRAGGDVSELATSLHQKPAAAASALLLTLVGLPFAFRYGRRGAVAGVGVAILLGLAYFFVSG